MARRRARQQFTPLEFEIMSVLWSQGPANVAAVQQGLDGSSPLAYTTVQTMLNILCRKGNVKRVLKRRAYKYAPTVSRKHAARAALRDVLNRLFGGSAEGLVKSLVEDRQLTPTRLAELTCLLAQNNDAARGRRDDSSRESAALARTPGQRDPRTRPGETLAHRSSVPLPWPSKWNAARPCGVCIS
jgi:BlaI family transcriptional regulator, penicillinase repressor